jgi:pilus assembly protein CpaF
MVRDPEWAPQADLPGAFGLGGPLTAVSPGDRATERVLRAQVRQEVSRLLDEQHLLRPRPEDEARIRVLIRERIAGFQRSAAVTNTPLIHDPAAMERRLFDGLLRLGPLQPLIENPEVEEIIINHPRRVFCIAGGRKRLVEDVVFDDDDDVRQLVKRLIGPLGRRLDESSPMVDARLPDGSRLNAAIPPATTRWCAVTVRKFIVPLGPNMVEVPRRPPRESAAPTGRARS